MKKNYLLVVLFIFIGNSIFSQSPYYNQRPEFLKANSHWAFGDHGGLDFSSGSPIPFVSSMYSYEGCATVSDPKTGKLLFYSNGEQVWNANHQLMPNGDSLKGNSNYSSRLTNINTQPGQNASSSQGVCIVPVIGTTDKYYLFSLVGSTVNTNSLAEGSLFYNIIDMSLDNGLGDIEPGKKNIPLSYDSLGSEALAAVPGNNCDIWLLALPIYSEELYAYHITNDGIDTTPVVSNIGASTWPLISMFSINPSPDRSKLAIIGSTAGFLGEFDPSTGLFSNRIDLDFYIRGGGTAFSPDNSKFYTGGAPTNGDLLQYDISTFNTIAINSSVQSIPVPNQARMLNYNTFRLYNDTIYFVNDESDMLNRIVSPNLSGTACGLEENFITVPLSGRMRLKLGGVPGTDVVLPLLKDTVFTKSDTLICFKQQGEGVSIEALYKDSHFNYKWNTGDTSSQIYISEDGQHSYSVSYGNGWCQNYVDSFTVTIDNVFTTITVDKFKLGTTGGPFASYQWLLNGKLIPNATNSTYTALENGNYQVIVTTNYGCIDTSAVYEVTNYTNIEDITTLKEKIHIYPNPVSSMLYIQAPFTINATITDLTGRLATTVERAERIDVKHLSKGIYFIRLYDGEGQLLNMSKFVKVD